MSEHYILLEFGYVPNSAYYKMAVGFAQRMHEYWCEGEGRNLKHFAPIDETKGEEWLELYNIVKNWKTTRLHYGDQIAAPVYTTLYMLACFIKRCEVEKKDEYCCEGNWIGCQRVLQGSKLGLGDGEFDSIEVFIPNKDAIHKSVNTFYPGTYSLCPVFDIDQARIEIDKLPSKILISETPNWIPIIKTEYHSGVTRLSGISYKDSNALKQQGPVVENINELEEYTFENERQFQEPDYLWEHKILSTNHENWITQAREGKVLEIKDLGNKGWMLVSTTLIDNMVYCVFQRKLTL